MKDRIFFIGLIPGFEIQREVSGFKNECSERFGASHALKSPPHITLIPPFRWPIGQLTALNETLDMFALGQEPFDIELSDFNCFRSRVLYVDVVPNASLLQLQRMLQKKLSKAHGLPANDGRRFHPHMTIAHRDLVPEHFTEARKLFSEREYRRIFSASRVTLLRHDGGIWQIEGHYFFE